MSQLRKRSDVERTAMMVDAIRRSYERTAMAPPYVVIEEVAPGTGGYGANRYADVLALSVWPSNGLTLHGFEVKASRADLRKELADPSKHQAIARYCDQWTLVVWDRKILEGFDIPLEWGILYADEDDVGGVELRIVRAAPKRTPEPWTRPFVCSLVRNAHQQSPGAAFVARAAIVAEKSGRKEGARHLELEVRDAVAPLAEALGYDSWNAPDLKRLVREAATKLAGLNPAPAPKK